MTDDEKVRTCCFCIPWDLGQKLLFLFVVSNAIAESLLVGLNYDMGNQIWFYVLTTLASIYLAVRYIIWIKNDSIELRRHLTYAWAFYFVALVVFNILELIALFADTKFLLSKEERTQSNTCL